MEAGTLVRGQAEPAESGYAPLHPVRHSAQSRRPAPRPVAGPAPRLLFVVNVDWFFLSHRLPLARAARAAGLQVSVAAADTGCGEGIEAEGLEFIPLPFTRHGKGVVREGRTLAALAQLYRRTSPDLVHHVTIKPVIYGSIVARLAGTAGVVNAISGLGYAFSPEAGVLRRGVEAAYRVALGGARTRTIFQNPDDRDEFVGKGLVRPEGTVLIRGAGVDPERFAPSPERPGVPVVMLAARMQRAKGVEGFVEAARRARAAGVDGRWVLVGGSDEAGAGGIPAAQLRAWEAEGVVEWWGHRSDMEAVLAQASVVVLPTFYREGLPKVLLEAASSGRPLVASDVPGCREIVRDGQNGFLIPPRDVDALASAVGRLLANPGLRRRMGAAGRALVEAEFTEERVVRQTLDLYRELLGARWPVHAEAEAPAA